MAPARSRYASHVRWMPFPVLHMGLPLLETRSLSTGIIGYMYSGCGVDDINLKFRLSPTPHPLQQPSALVLEFQQLLVIFRAANAWAKS